jgi:hypothetical protein
MDDTQLEQRPDRPVWFLSAQELAATRAELATITGRAVRKGFTGSIDLVAVPATRTYAWAAVQALGWTPASAPEPGRTPTRDVVRQVLTQQRAADRLLAVLSPHLAEGRRLAPRIIDTLLTGLTGESGYEANLAAVLRGQSVDARHLGLSVSAIPAHQDAMAAADHVGVVGDKITATGTVRTAIRVDGFTYHSPDSILMILDCGTAVAKMTTAASWAYRVKVCDPLTVTGTVKARTVWNGVKQTVLVRPKKLDQPAATLPQAPPALDVTGRERVDSPRLDGASADRKALAPTPTLGLAVPR